MMNFIEIMLRRPRTVLTVMVALIVAGIGAYLTLPKESMPDIEVPYLIVSVSQSGVSPSDAERLLARPLETELRDLDGLVSYSTTASNGSASVALEFGINSDLDTALADTRARVDAIRSRLPDDANDPIVSEVSVSAFPTISVAVYGNVPERTLVAYADRLRDALETIPTVREVERSGARDEVLEVTVDLLRLEAYNLTTNELFDALARNNLVVPAGSLDTGQGRFNLEVPGLIQTSTDVFNLPVKSDGQTVVTFGDVATITRTFRDATNFTRVNGEPAILLGVSKRLGTNIIENSQLVRDMLATATADWPVTIQTAVMLDQAEFAIQTMSSLESSVLTAIALVMIASIAMLGVRPALLIGLSIPISFVIAFFFLQLTGTTINMIVMFGLVLTVGMLVDSAIVVVEYADRKQAEGLPPREAYIRAVRLMLVPILSSTATTVAAFIPLLLWPGLIGKFMGYLPLMVIITLCASLITAMVFIPVVGGLISRRKVSAEEQEAARRLSSAEGAFDPRQVPGFTGAYVRALSVLVKAPLISTVVLVGGIVGIFYLYAANPTGVEAFPATEAEYATVAVTGRGNYSPTEIRDLLVEVEQEILQIQGIREVTLNFGATGAVAATPPDTIGNLQMVFQPYRDRMRAAGIFEEIRQRTAHIAGIGIELIGAEEGPPTGKDINLRLLAANNADLAPAVARIRNHLETGMDNVIEIEDGLPLPGIDWQITVDRVEAARYGIGVRDLSPYIQLVTAGVQLGTYRPDDATDELQIRVRLPEDQRTFDALDSLRIITPQGQVPVSNFIDRQPVPRIASIQRFNGQYTMSVRANVTGTDPATGQEVMAADKVAELQAWMATEQWPSGLTFDFTGAQEQTDETNAFLLQAGTAAIFLMFLILLTQFNSFYQVFLTLSTVVMSVAGVLLGMLITGQAFSAIMTGVGIISLAAIIVNNAIILIDTFNRFRSENVDPVDATLMTAAQRLRPILLTTITTVLGLLPMAMGVNIDFFNRTISLGDPSGMWWAQLSTAVVSGLSFATILTLVVVPVLLAAPTIWKRQLAGLWAFATSSRRRPAPAGFDGTAVAEGEGHLVSRDIIDVDGTEVAVPRRHAAE